jgi:hypothetical protein
LSLLAQHLPRSCLTTSRVVKFVDEVAGGYIDSLSSSPWLGLGCGAEEGLAGHRRPFLVRIAATLLCEPGDILERSPAADHDTCRAANGSAARLGARAALLLLYGNSRLWGRVEATTKRHALRQ